MFVHLLAMFVHWNLKGIICSFVFNKHVNLHLIVTDSFGGNVLFVFAPLHKQSEAVK